MKNVSDEILREIGNHREWTKRYGVSKNLVCNPRTPIGVALSLVPRLNPRDIKGISVDRNVPEPVRKQAQKFVKAPQQRAEPAMSDYYELLGVAPSASAAEVRQAYVRLAREKHPDRFPDPAEKQRAQSAFQDITTAFNTLMQPEQPPGVRRDAAQAAAPDPGGDRDRRLRAGPAAPRGGPVRRGDHAAAHRGAPRSRARPRTTPRSGAPSGGSRPSRGRPSRSSRRRRSSSPGTPPRSPTSPSCSPGRG